MNDAAGAGQVGHGVPKNEREFHRWVRRKLDLLWQAIQDQFETKELQCAQRAFLLSYFGFAVLPDATLECRMARIEKLIAMQMPGHPGARYCLRASSSRAGQVELYLQCPGDVDFADLHEVVDLRELRVQMLDGLIWDSASAGAFVQAIIDHMRDHGPKPKLTWQVVDSTLAIIGDWEGKRSEHAIKGSSPG